MKDITLKQLVMEAQQENQQAKEEILGRFHPLLLKNIMKYFGGNQEMEDLLQEGRVVLLEAIRDFNPHLGVPFEAYAQKRIFYYYADLRKKRRELLILDKPLHGGSRLMDLLESRDPSPEERMIGEEEAAKLHQGILRLSPKQQEVIQSYYFHGKSLKALAGEKGVCYQALIKRKARAIARLRRNIPGK